MGVSSDLKAKIAIVAALRLHDWRSSTEFVGQKLYSRGRLRSKCRQRARAADASWRGNTKREGSGMLGRTHYNTYAHLKTWALGAAFGAAAAATFGATSPVHAADNWQAYTYWGTPNVIASRNFRKLTEEIEQASNGELKIKFNLGGTLSINAININSAVSDDIVQIATDAYYHGSIPLAGISSLPFLVHSIDDMNKLMAIVRPLAERDFAKKGVTVLGWYAYPPQVFWFRGNVSSLADVKNRKIRVTSAEQGEVIKSFGGTPVQLGSADVPAALERGIVDGILTASAGGINAWKELLKSSYGMGVNYPVSYIIVNSDRFNKLPADLQAKMREMVTKTMTAQIAELQSEDIELRKKFGTEGITMYDAKAEEMTQAENAMKPYWESWAKARGPEAVKTLQDVRKALGR
jgi:TRAP-type C4-dicarboxylate transport system substrate-binding protein